MKDFLIASWSVVTIYQYLVCLHFAENLSILLHSKFIFLSFLFIYLVEFLFNVSKNIFLPCIQVHVDFVHSIG